MTNNTSPSALHLLAPWPSQHGGVPPFDKVNIDAFAPAIAEAMAAYRKEIAAIATGTAPATFSNTIVALEDAGRGFSRVTNLYATFAATMNDKAMQKVERELAPALAAFADEITQNAALFARIKVVYDGAFGKPPAIALDPEQLRLVDTVYRSFARRGAALSEDNKAQLGAINQRLASLYTIFSQNALADEERFSLTLANEADLAGLPDSLRAGLEASAQAKSVSGWLLSNTRSAVEPFLTYSTRRDLREAAWRMWMGRGGHAGEHDNKPVITEILSLRSERAKLLGFASHAHWSTDDNMAKTPEAARALLLSVWGAAVLRAREEIADMQVIANAEGAGHTIAPWDHRHYAEKVRKATYDIDQNEVKPYLQLDKMRESMFWMAEQLYDLRFSLLKDVPVYHPDVTAYEVTRDGQRVGLWYFDPYARPGKLSGAWMSEYRGQERFEDNVRPIVSNNSNFVKGEAGVPVLISWDDAVTLFHEFGHALHGLNSSVRYPTLAGTNTLRDFVEFPSQLHEHWLPTPELLDRFARHYQTGAAIPAQLVTKLRRAKNFNQGFKTVEYLAAAIYDLEIHCAATNPALDPVAFEDLTMAELDMPPAIVMRHRPPHFSHIFSGDGYSAGYYSYIWADTLTADAAEAFVEAGGLYNKALAKHLLETVLAVGNTVAPDVAFRQFRGRDVDATSLMRDRGFVGGV